MKSVRHVSMVEREVALTLRVTDRPKKLKPLGQRSANGWSSRRRRGIIHQVTYPILIMIRMLETPSGL